MKIDKKSLISAAVSGLFLAASAQATCPVAAVANGNGEVGQCHGINQCKGQGACGGVKEDGTKYTCAGNNECKGKGWLKMTKEQCDEKDGEFKEG